MAPACGGQRVHGRPRHRARAALYCVHGRIAPVLALPGHSGIPIGQPRRHAAIPTSSLRVHDPASCVGVSSGRGRRRVHKVRRVVGVNGLQVIRVDHHVVHDSGDEGEEEHGGNLGPGL